MKAKEQVEDIYELTPLQEALLLDSILGDDAGLYLIQLRYLLRGHVDVAALGRALERVVARHGVLRTSFHWEDLEKPLQAVHGAVELPLTEYDWRGLPEPERKERLATFLRDDRERGVDFHHPPLMRVALFRTATDEFELLWSFHHILFEGWSASVLLGELLQLYRAERRGEEASLPEARAYRDYISWIHEQDSAAAERYWREALKGFSSPTPMPFGSAPGDLFVPIEDYATCQAEISADTSAALRRQARTHGLTLNTLVQGAWAILLSRYSGEADVVFGSVVSGRSAPLDGIESMVGLFIGVLPVRLQIAGGAGLADWLRELQRVQAEQRRFEYVAPMQIRSWSEVPGRAPLFETLVIFENWLGDLDLDQWDHDLKVEEVGAHQGGQGYPIALVVEPAERMTLSITYDCQRFSRDAIERMLGHLATILEGIGATLRGSVDEVPLLTTREERQLLVEWNETADEAPACCLHELFEAQVDRTPDSVAAVFADHRLTYRELEERANRLARHLGELGVGVGSNVGIFTERSVEMLVAMLGTLKAGAAYVPLDPDFPDERLAFMIEDSGVSALLTHERLARNLERFDGALVRMDKDWPTVEQRDAARRPSGATAAAVAYVIYTSGSTGRPKGVAVQHAAVVNLLTAMTRRPGLAADDVLLAVTTLSFDISVLELLLPLTVGARVVILSHEDASDGNRLAAAIQNRSATVMQATPATWSMLLSAGWEGRRGLVALCGGEELPRDLAEDLSSRVDGLWNLYGPTEATVWSMVHRVEQRSGPVPIGRPIGNTRVYILDPQMRPLPVGVPGELFIGGAGVALGYWNRPDLTAERFVASPFDDDAGVRLYRTGDVARYRVDGEIEFLGRADHQVKVRGFRIELGEIEWALKQHQATLGAVVVTREYRPGDKRLIAYFLPHPDELEPTGTELRRFLRDKLPAYMVPAAFVALAEFPLTPNGKIDRKALPEPEIYRSEGETSVVPPSTEMEVAVADIWKEVLGIPAVGVDDNFFDLGGHSLLSIQAIYQIEKRIGVRLNARDMVFQTLRQLAAFCQKGLASAEPA